VGYLIFAELGVKRKPRTNKRKEAVLKVRAAFFYLFFSPKITILAAAKKTYKSNGKSSI